MINIKGLDPNNIKKDKKSYTNILTYYTGYVMVKYLRYLKNHRINPLYLIAEKINGYIEKSNGNKYLALVLPMKV